MSPYEGPNFRMGWGMLEGGGRLIIHAKKLRKQFGAGWEDYPLPAPNPFSSSFPSPGLTARGRS